MNATFAFSHSSSALRAVSPYLELGAYEALWTEERASFKSLARRFAAEPGSLPSDFVPEEKALHFADLAASALRRAGIKRFGIRVHGAGEYPEKLLTEEHPVKVIYYQGWWDLVDSPSVAVIGTRDPSPQGRAWARRIVRNLVQNGYTVVSGLARGIDTEAHRTAIEMNGRTIAVIGTPLNLRYPSENARLQEELAEEHLVISQVPVIRYQQVDNPTENRSFFIERNITMSALTLGTVVIEAGQKSDAVVQAKHALRQGRKLFILDNNFRNPNLSWPHTLKALGAVMVRDYDDIRMHLLS